MAISSNPLAPDATTDIDGPEVHQRIEPIKDLEAEEEPEDDRDQI
jgi:hypothetical protein